MTLIDLFDLSLRGRAGAPALDFGQETYTFGELDDRSNRLAQFLLTEGVRPGDRLCVYLANCVEMIELYLACVKTGVIFVPINILYRDREISHILRDAEPRAVISDEPLAASTTIWTRAQVRAAIQGNWPTRPAVRLDADSPAGIIYTSGTTGTSKGAVLTHNNFAVNALNLLTCWQITSSDRFLLALPLFHVHGLGNGLHCWHERLSNQAAGTFFASNCNRNVSSVSANAVLRRSDDVCPNAGMGARHRSRDRLIHAALCFRFGPAARGRAG
jgi:malonyl-CoA/methylmalonyl-CoA synthetase